MTDEQQPEQTRDERIGERIRRIRDGVGITQAELAQFMTDTGNAGWHPQTVVKVERGRRTLKFAEGMSLARFLAVQPEELLGATTVSDVEISVIASARRLRMRHEEALVAFGETVAASAELVGLASQDDVGEWARDHARAALDDCSDAHLRDVINGMAAGNQVPERRPVVDEEPPF